MAPRKESGKTGNEAAYTPPDRTRSRRGPRHEEDVEAEPGQAEDIEGEKIRSDCGPWIEPSSTRVESYRYDYLNRQIQCTWANNIGPGHTYDVDYEVFRRFARSNSKGKFINRVLNGYNPEKIDPHIRDLPSNPRRKVPAGTR
jgi:KTSC domain